MKKFYEKVWKVLPIVWEALWVAIITVGSTALLLVLIKWFLRIVGVI